jgi:hypothetical protein
MTAIAPAFHHRSARGRPGAQKRSRGNVPRLQ